VTSHLLHVVGDVTVNRLGQVHIAYFISEMSILNVSRLIWYSKKGPGLAAGGPPSFLLAVPNVTAHPSTASVPTSYCSMWHYNYLVAMVANIAANNLDRKQNLTGYLQEMVKSLECSHYWANDL